VAWKSWRGHSIGHNSRSRRPSLFVFVSVASKERPQKAGCNYVENELRCGAATLVEWRRGRKPRYEPWTFTTANGFWSSLWTMLSPRRVVWCISHGMLHTSTLLRMWERLETGKLYTSDTQVNKTLDVSLGDDNKRLWKGLLAIDGLPFHMQLKHDGKRLNISDIKNYYPLTLDTIGQSVGIHPEPVPSPESSEEDWLSYCKTSVEIVKESYLGLVRQWEKEDNGNWKMSAAGLAWNNFRHTRDCSDIIVHNHGNARDMEWEAYYGGECRAWFRGICPSGVIHLDVNSLYPSVMAGNQYPIELVDHIVTPSPYIVDSLSSRYELIADVTMTNICDDIPVRHNGRVIYPVGCFRTRLAGPEFRVCVKGNCISKIHAINYYKRADIFTSYVRRWYDSKARYTEECNRAGEQFTKLMLNSLFGKFSQRTKAWETNHDAEALRPWSVYPDKIGDSDRYEMVRTIGYSVQQLQGWRETSNTFPAISAYVTSYARERMRFLRRHIPPYALYYQDTDSLFVCQNWFNTEGKDMLDIGTGLGQLRIVNHYKEVTIRGAKNYTADGRDCISGVKSTDKSLGGTTYEGIRMETAAKVITRYPDGAIRSWSHTADFPGTCREGGYTKEGWSVPATLGLTKPATADRLTT